MSTYKISDIIDRLTEIQKDGFFFVNIGILEADDDFPESITFEAVDDDCFIGYDSVESHDILPIEMLKKVTS